MVNNSSRVKKEFSSIFNNCLQETLMFNAVKKKTEKKCEKSSSLAALQQLVIHALKQ